MRYDDLSLKKKLLIGAVLPLVLMLFLLLVAIDSGRKSTHRINRLSQLHSITGEVLPMSRFLGNIFSDDRSFEEKEMAIDEHTAELISKSHVFRSEISRAVQIVHADRFVTLVDSFPVLLHAYNLNSVRLDAFVDTLARRLSEVCAEVVDAGLGDKRTLVTLSAMSMSAIDYFRGEGGESATISGILSPLSRLRVDSASSTAESIRGVLALAVQTEEYLTTHTALR